MSHFDPPNLYKKFSNHPIWVSDGTWSDFIRAKAMLELKNGKKLSIDDVLKYLAQTVARKEDYSVNMGL